MELVLYCILFFVTILYALLQRSKLYKHCGLISLLSVAIIAYVISIRSYNMADMIVYEETFENLPLKDMIVSPYYLGCFAFWIPLKLLYLLFGSTQIVFIFVDILLVCLLEWILRKLDIPSYVLGLFLVSFIGVLGMQNIYRQYGAVILLLTSCTCAFEKRKWWAFLWFGIACLYHNSIALFAIIPFLLYYEGKPRVWITPTYLVAAALFSYSKGFYSRVAGTGLDLSVAYLLLVLFFGFVLAFLSKHTASLKVEDSVRTVTKVLLALELIIFITSGTIAVERFSMEILAIMLLFTAKVISMGVKQKELVSLFLVFIYSLPTLFFDSTMLFLDNAESLR